MKKMLCAVLAALIAIVPAVCISGALAESAAFQPRLDPDTECTISVIGSYSNFEALEAEFDRFNEYYPDVELNYTKPDDYNNLLGTVLESNNAPNIFFASQWMIGNEKYQQAVDHMEDLSDPALGLELDCLRPGLLSRDADGHLPSGPEDPGRTAGRVRGVPRQGLCEPDDGLQRGCLRLPDEHPGVSGSRGRRRRRS